MKHVHIIELLLLLWLCFGYADIEHAKQETKIAFMADVHFADVFPSTQELPAEIATDTANEKKVLVRTMEAQLHSTRLFNENYFAFTAALDDAVQRGIRLIALPGDFSDDGQPLHVKGLKKILDRYVEQYGVSFFVINGNHDPTRPFGKAGGKADFLGAKGNAQPIMSEQGMYNSQAENEPAPAVLPAIKEWGYQGIVNELHQFGFFPNEEYLFWQTPFATYKYEEYTFGLAQEAAQFHKRSYVFDDGTIAMPDVSYVVEPVAGLWLLALDASVYIPKKDGLTFNGAGIGYNEVITHKQYLVDWTAKVVAEANRLGKTLIAFSHYPMVEFNDGASKEMKALFGETKFQAHRIPSEIVGETFANVGLKVHVGGHMHVNDTGVITTKKGNTLTNIQTPSLAAYVPGYKVITVKQHGNLEVETITLDSVAGFNSFFDLYKKEQTYLRTNFPERAWNDTILKATSYREFTNEHLKSLVQLRFLKNDWPPALQEQVVNKTGWQLLLAAAAQQNDTVTNAQSGTIQENLLKTLAENGFQKTDFQQWTGLHLIIDFYRLRNADALALSDIDAKRIQEYELLFALLLNPKTNNKPLTQLQQFAVIFKKQLQGAPAVNFKIK